MQPALLIVEDETLLLHRLAAACPRLPGDAAALHRWRMSPAARVAWRAA